LRFIPYVGPWIGALLPIALSLAAFEGWMRPLLVIGLFLVLELFCNMVLETWLYGQSAGVSQVALLVAIAFWTWLWGPVGLLLATPLTVCLVVLSKYVPEMEFLGVLMIRQAPVAPRAAVLPTSSRRGSGRSRRGGRGQMPASALPRPEDHCRPLGTGGRSRGAKPAPRRRSGQHRQHLDRHLPSDPALVPAGVAGGQRRGPGRGAERKILTEEGAQPTQPHEAEDADLTSASGGSSARLSRAGDETVGRRRLAAVGAKPDRDLDLSLCS